MVGGGCAASLLALSGLISLALLGTHATESLPLLQFGQRLSVALGGTGFAAFTGLPGPASLSDAAGASLAFSLAADGTVAYDPALEGVLTGRGTSTLTVVGVPSGFVWTTRVTTRFWFTSPTLFQQGLILLRTPRFRWQ